MTDAISHRGPDGEGHWMHDNVAIGHRRLSIIDLTDTGSQPMVSADGRFVLTYNGELYNFRELRSELIKLGQKFDGSSDTEVALKALASWGPSALLRFNGMFSLALWDGRKQQMLIARDRYGVKPLYYGLEHNRFSFASEQKAITLLPGFTNNLDQEALVEYFTFQNIFTDRTLVERIKILPAGTYATLTSGDPILRMHKYWDFHFEEPDGFADERLYVEEARRLLEQSVNRQLVGDVEIGCYLSGGIDSGAISSIASRSITDLKTFTIGFDLSSASGLELAFDERARAEELSGVFKTEHYERVLKSGDLSASLPKVAYHLEEPRVGQSYPNFYAAKLASKFVKVVLSGSGGDELFGGYPWRYFRSHSRSSFEGFADQYYRYWQRLVSDQELRSLFSPIWKSVQHVSTKDIFRGVLSGHQGKYENQSDYINHSMYLEAKTFLHGLLVVEDKLSMAHGLETRVPFLDNDLVDFALKLPVSLKVNMRGSINQVDENSIAKKVGSDLRNDGKRVLRSACEAFLPESSTQARKQGFSAPDASWFKGESIQFVRDKLLDTSSEINSIFDRKTILEIVNEHTTGKQNRRLVIWSLLNFQELLTQN